MDCGLSTHPEIQDPLPGQSLDHPGLGTQGTIKDRASTEDHHVGGLDVNQSEVGDKKEIQTVEQEAHRRSEQLIPQVVVPVPAIDERRCHVTPECVSADLPADRPALGLNLPVDLEIQAVRVRHQEPLQTILVVMMVGVAGRVSRTLELHMYVVLLCPVGKLHLDVVRATGRRDLPTDLVAHTRRGT